MNEETKKCPFCAETIKAEAIVCRFCGRNLPGKASPSSGSTPVSNAANSYGKPSGPGLWIALGLVVVFGCYAISVFSRTAAPGSTTGLTPTAPLPAASAAPAAAVSSSAPVDPVFGVQAGFSPRYAVSGAPEPIDVGAVRRTKAKIIIPPGLAREEVEMNLRQAAKTFYEQRPVDALSVFAYKEGTDLESAYSAGRLELAPGGVWSQAHPDTPLEELRPKIDLEEAYFHKRGTTPVVAKKGIGEATRKRIYFLESQVEEEAQNTAEQEVQGFDLEAIKRRSNRQDDLIDAGKARIAKQFHIKREDVDEIVVEGAMNYWPAFHAGSQ